MSTTRRITSGEELKPRKGFLAAGLEIYAASPRASEDRRVWRPLPRSSDTSPRQTPRDVASAPRGVILKLELLRNAHLDQAPQRCSIGVPIPASNSVAADVQGRIMVEKIVDVKRQGQILVEPFTLEIVTEE
jgi:hypothetical protein